jgi:membrane protease YdiL (CAAX protease family)
MVASFYVGLALLGFIWHAVSQDDNDVWRLASDQEISTLCLTPLIGVVFGLAVVGGFRWLESRMTWLPELHREFRGVLGRPGYPELVLLAAASSIGEEILFRGAMLDAWGLAISSIVFAVLHIPPRRALWPWTLSAGALGLALGGLTLWTGNLGAAVAAHFVINLLNLVYITRNTPGVALGAPVRPR